MLREQNGYHETMWKLALALSLSAALALGQTAAAPSASSAAPASASPSADTPQTHPAAVTVSPGYEKRLTIHRYASYATIPLFASELILGNELYNHPDRSGVKTAHGAVSTGIVALFGVNTFTGVWNMWDDRHNPDGRRLRTAHALLMLAADAGFAATALSSPHTHGPQAANFDTQRATHRNLAYVSVGVATIGYAIMLFRRH